MSADDTSDWIAEERRILELQAAEQRHGICRDYGAAQSKPWRNVVDSCPAEAPDIVLSLISQPENYERAKLLQRFPYQEESDHATDWELMHKYSGRSWGIPRIIHQFLTVRPILAANLLYSRRSARILSTTFTLVFGLLGILLLQESVGVRTLDLVYSVHQTSLEFFLHEELEAPTFVYLTSSLIWQNSRDFLASQPPFLPSGVSCEEFVTAKTFCDWRPRILFEHEGLKKGFCDFPGDTPVAPCGRFNLWMNRDELQLWKLAPSKSRHWPQGHFVDTWRHLTDDGGSSLALQPDGIVQAVRLAAQQSPSGTEPLEEVVLDSSKHSVLGPAARIAFEEETRLIKEKISRPWHYNATSTNVPQASRYTSEISTPIVQWLPADDVRWFLWRRPASTSFILTLYGVIRENLPSTTYRFSFPVNEFHPMPPSGKGIRLVSNLASFGTTQFSVACLCFLTAALYSLLWCV